MRGLCKAVLGVSHQLRCLSESRGLTITRSAKTCCWTHFKRLQMSEFTKVLLRGTVSYSRESFPFIYIHNGDSRP